MKAHAIAAPVHESTLPPILGVKEMGALLGMNFRSVYRAMKRPEWPFTQLPAIDSRPRWSRDQVLATIASARVLPPRRRSA